jgi:type II secretory pathway pseudopilin PulG
MKRHASQHPDLDRSAAFTLIEMIGVLAIMAIMASVLVPNVLRSMDRAAVRAEAETLKALGEQVRLYTRIYGAPPASGTWQTDLASRADLAAVDILTNRRGMARNYVLDTTTAPVPRLMIISSMRGGLVIPAISAAQFQSIWQTADKTVPAGWAAWAAVAGSAEQLLIERVNLQPIYQTELVNVTFNNRGAVPVRCSYILPSQPAVTVTQTVPVSPPGLPLPLKLPAGVRVDLYDTAGKLNYAYVARDPGQAFEFNGTNWIPK